MNNGRLSLKTLITLISGEAFVSLICSLIYLAIQRFSFRVPLGSLLGSAVVIANFVVMSLISGRILDEFMRERGEGEMSDEEINELVAKYQGRIQNQMKLSFIIRNAAMVITLALAFLIDAFDVIATLVPLLMYQPLIMLSELIGRKRGIK